MGLVEDTVNVCDAGAPPPATPENVSDDWLRVAVGLDGTVETTNIPILFPGFSVNQMLPSGPVAMPSGPEVELGTGNSVTTPPGVILPIAAPLIAVCSVNQRLPSGPWVIVPGIPPEVMYRTPL